MLDSRAPLAAVASVLLSAALSLAATIPEGTIRLAGKRYDAGYEGEGYQDKIAGILQIYHNSQWGSVCAEGFDDYDGAVGCRQMGLGYYYWYYDLYYFYYDDDDYLVGSFVRNPEEDTGIIWLDGSFNCGGYAEGSLLECGSYYAWGDTICEKSQDVTLWCHYPDVPKLEDPLFVLDFGFGPDFGEPDTKCVPIRERLHLMAVEWSHTADETSRRRGVTTTTVTTTMWKDTTAALCTSVYSGGQQTYNAEEPHEFEITHRGGDEVCVSRTDGHREWYGWIRLLCRYVDLTSPLVSYRDKGECGPRGNSTVVDASGCPSGLMVVASASADGELEPIAVVGGGDCPIFEITVHECYDEVAAEPACADFTPPGGGSWHDADGESFGCEWYFANSVCAVANSGFGRTAAEACCSCGGGTAEVIGTLTFRSTGTQAEVEAAALLALTELLGIDEGVLAPALQVTETDSRTTTTATSTVSRTFTETTTTSSSTDPFDTVTATSTTFATSTTTDVTVTTTAVTITTTTATAEDPLGSATWWRADYALSLGLSACQQIAERSDNATGTAQLLALRLGAANLTLDDLALYLPAARLTPKPPTATTSTGTTTSTSTTTTTAAPTAASAAGADAAGEPSQGVPTAMAVGLGAGALAVGLAAGALAVRFGRGSVAPTNGRVEGDANKEDGDVGTTTRNSDVFDV